LRIRDNFSIFQISAVSSNTVVTGGTYVYGSGAYSVINLKQLDRSFGHRNWKVIQECFFFNVPNTRVMKIKLGVSRNLVTPSFVYSTERTLTNSAGAARSAKIRNIVLPSEIITALPEAETESIYIASMLGSDAGTNLNAYGAKLYVVPLHIDLDEIFQLGVG
jgi:hypothetical protein